MSNNAKKPGDRRLIVYKEVSYNFSLDISLNNFYKDHNLLVRRLGKKKNITKNYQTDQILYQQNLFYMLVSNAFGKIQQNHIFCQ